MFKRSIILCVLVFLWSHPLESAQERGEDKARLCRYQCQYFKKEIDKLVDLYGAKANVGIDVVSLKTGHCLYQRSADTLFVPASCLKLMTGAAALDILGPQYVFFTKLFTDGKVEGRALKGNLYLKGSGDPELTSKDLEELAISLKLLGIEKIEGSLFVDTTDFDGVSQGPGWMWDDAPEYWNSPMDALTVNHSCIKVWVCPGAKCDEMAKVYVNFKTPHVKIDNEIKTDSLQEGGVSIMRKEGKNKNKIVLKGSIAPGSQPKSFDVSIDRPHIYAGHVFLSLLAKHTIAITNQLEEKKVPQGASLLAEHSSRPLREIVQKMMKDSDNLYADCLFKKMAQVKHQTTGSWSLGSKTLREFLRGKVGLATSEMVILDGSGVSRYNLVSPRQLTQLMIDMKTRFTYSAEFIASLPISGVDGSLKGAMDDKVLVSKVRAKSGSMKGIRTLSGYVTTKEGEELVFSIMMNGFIEPRPKEGKLENEICKFLVGYSSD